MKNLIKLTMLFSLVLSFYRIAPADVIELRYTIQNPVDSARIEMIAPIGDFNADGYDDLALGILGTHANLYSAVHLYFGGPYFDDQADLIFQGLPQDTVICRTPEDIHTGYGVEITRLGDYNGDGYDDFAVGSPNLCYGGIDGNGAVYIYFGSPSPDTIADIFIPGEGGWDGFGAIMVNGDFNGDTYGDLHTIACRNLSDQKVYIFLGSDPANGQYDFKWNLLSILISVRSIRGGRDINDDGFDDFLWDFLDYMNDTSGTMLFFGGDPIDTLPFAEIINTSFYLEDDFSDDGVDDFIITAYNPPGGHYLCLGGDPFNTVPDCEIPTYLNFLIPSVFTSPTGERKFVMDDGVRRRINFYNTGIPLDTTDYETFYYWFQHGYGPDIIGDIDGIPGDEITLSDYPRQLLFIYSGIQSGIGDDEDDSVLPEKQTLISAYPNPFNSACKITVSDPRIELVEIYDITGRLVQRLRLSGGEAFWNASSCVSGIYFARAGAGDYSRNIKIVLLK